MALNLKTDLKQKAATEAQRTQSNNKGGSSSADPPIPVQSIALRLCAFSTCDRVSLHTQVRIRFAWSTLQRAWNLLWFLRLLQRSC